MCYPKASKTKMPEFSFKLILLLTLAVFLASCRQAPENYKPENTPTSGHLKVYFEEGLEKHVRNQAFTFASIYYRASLDLFPTSEDSAVQALFQDSCEAIVITRLLREKEIKAFASRKYAPDYSLVAKTGLAIICNAALALNKLRYSEVLALLTNSNTIQDSLGNQNTITLLIDKSGSAVYNYLKDSLLNGNPLPAYFSSLNSGLEAINYVTTNKNAIAFIDFALFSDVDDSLSKVMSKNTRVLAIGAKTHNGQYEKPNQSSFKKGTYPFTRNIYVMRKIGDFTLAKGFESFVAGPKGQTIFLKQGLLPSRQQERAISVNFEALDLNK
jgi:phosphate transport system substrate-binding protein